MPEGLGVVWMAPNWRADQKSVGSPQISGLWLDSSSLATAPSMFEQRIHLLFVEFEPKGRYI